MEASYPSFPWLVTDGSSHTQRSETMSNPATDSFSPIGASTSGAHRLAAAAAIMVAACAAFPPYAAAATAVPTTTAEATAAGYVTMTAADAWGSCFTYSTLDDGNGIPYAGRVWSDGAAISAGKNYFAHTTTVAGGGTGNTPGTLTIPGQAGDIFVYSGGTHSFRNTTKLDFRTRRVVVRNGAKIAHYQDWLNLCAQFLEVQSTAASPFVYELNAANNTAGKARRATLTVALVGDADACMVLQPAQAEAGLFSEQLIGDASDFLGTMEVRGNGKVTAAGTGHFVALGCSSFGGTVEAADGGGVSAMAGTNVAMRALSLLPGGIWHPGSQTWTIGDLSVSDGCRIANVTTSTRIVVTNSVAHGDAPVTFDFGGATVFTYDTNTSATKPAETNVILTLASGVAATLDDFAVTNVGTGPYGIPHWRLELIPGENGVTSLALVHDEVVIATASGLTPSSTSWSDGLAVHADAEYYAKWYQFAPDVADHCEYTFPGSCLTTIGSVTPWCEGTVAAKLVLPVRKSGEDAVRLYFYASNLSSGHDRLQYIAGGTVTVPAHSDAGTFAVFQGYMNNYFRLDSSLEGDGDIHVQIASNVSDPRFRAEFTGLNTNYMGKITVTTPVFAGDGAKPATPTKTYSTRFHMRDARNVGGKLAAFAWDGFTVANMSCVVVTNDLLFDASLNRGIAVISQGRFDVADGAALTLATPITFAGELVKEGAGTLALSAKPRFIDGEETTAPVAGANVLRVAEGALKIAGAEALAGLAVTFAAGTALHIPAVTDDADLAAYGAAMTQPTSSISVEQGRIALVADDVSPAAKKIVCPVATFATKAEADAAVSLLKPVSLSSELQGSLAVRTTTEGYTVVATWSHSATVLILR